MLQFWHGWRRKVGCVALVMALPASCLWVRSLIAPDSVEFLIAGQQHTFVIADGLIFWHRHHGLYTAVRDPDRLRMLVDWLISESTKPRFSGCVIPIWMIVWPLTLLSAILLLWPIENQRRQKTAHRRPEALGAREVKMSNQPTNPNSNSN